MPIEELISQRITGVEPFNELPIDADVWREAHGQHSSHRQLHATAAHRPGIVYGLEVFPSRQQERTVVVAPGVAIDSEGRTIVLSEPASFTLDEKGQIYITIAFENNLDSRSEVVVGGGKKHYRLIEGRQVVASKELPRTPYLELARIDRSGKDKPVSEAAQAFDPDEDELNLLYRQLSFPHCFADGGIGELCFLPLTDPNAWKPNRAGLYNLIREANGLGFHLSFEGLFNLRNGGSGNEPVLLYVSCAGEFQPLNADQTEGLKRYLEAGGFLFGDASGAPDGFIGSFGAIGKAIQADLKPVTTGSPLLLSHHMFPEPPPGASDQGVLVADLEKGVLLSTFNYGGAWQGSVGSGSRDRVRQAVEFGLNIVAFAAARKRRTVLARM